MVEFPDIRDSLPCCVRADGIMLRSLGAPVRRAGLDRKIDAVAADRRRLADLYPASFIEREELVRHGKQEIGTPEQRATRMNRR